MDEDTGLNNEDDPVCSGGTIVEVDVTSSGTIDTWGPEGALADRCRVSYTVEPLGGPTVAAGDEPPLPHLIVEGMRVGQDTDLLYINVRNVGTSAWAGHDLTVAVERQSGEPIGTFMWPAVELPAGEILILGHHDLAPERPMDTCVILDPENVVRELLDRSAEAGMIDEPLERYCAPLPDLTITDVAYREDALLVTVENASDVAVEYREFELQVNLVDGEHPDVLTESWDGISIAPQDSVDLTWPDIAGDYRERLRNGFAVMVDSNDEIAETDEDNNTYDNTFVRMRVEFTGLRTPSWGCEGWGHQNAEFYFLLYVGYGPSEEETYWVGHRVRYPESDTIRLNRHDDPFPRWDLEGEQYTFEFDMPAEDNLYIMILGFEQDPNSTDSLGNVETGYGPDVDYGHSSEEYEAESSGQLSEYCDDWEPLTEHTFRFDAWWRITRVD